MTRLLNTPIIGRSADAGRFLVQRHARRAVEKRNFQDAAGFLRQSRRS